ncbi:unnamed protein product [Strongylus vulgaris]|uniref:Uncharacterized protein n=1 Tax=Strongylus vulgaris TaxID=40348 RepID=A0A3P7JJF1_STRVU|nr:unnamed protein product [Strongylus vulgaris]
MYAPLNKSTPSMQVRLHARNTFAVIIGIGFIYLAYLIFFKAGDGFPEIDVDLNDVVSPSFKLNYLDHLLQNVKVTLMLKSGCLYHPVGWDFLVLRVYT